MTLGDMIDLFRIRAQDTKKPYLWPDPELALAFSEAEGEAAVRSLLIHDTDELSFTAGESGPASLPAALFDIQYAELRAADGAAYEIAGASRRELDRIQPGWRTRTERPTNYVHDDNALFLSAITDQAYTLYIEFFRLPKAPLVDDGDAPEISESHHANLVDWVLYRAFSKPDADGFDPKRAGESLNDFESYFGRRSTADQRRRQNAGRPQRNKVHA